MAAVRLGAALLAWYGGLCYEVKNTIVHCEGAILLQCYTPCAAFDYANVTIIKGKKSIEQNAGSYIFVGHQNFLCWEP